MFMLMELLGLSTVTTVQPVDKVLNNIVVYGANV